jgi:adenylate cyclase
VLPFVNMSGDRDQDYFSDGITEDIITEISRIPALLVIARNSTFTYKGKAAKVQDICRDLGVRYVLEGSVRKSGPRIRVTAQLIDGHSGGHLWAERYDRELADIFAVQDDVTAQIVRALELTLVDAHRAPSSRVETDNPEAYDCVLRGREHYRLFTKEGDTAARRLYERAIELDPSYAAAYAGLAETYLHDWFLGTPEALDRAFELAQRARSLDPHLPLVYEALSGVQLFTRQHDGAVAAATRWLEIEPGNAEAYATLAGILHFAGEPERVGGLIEKAKRLNPFHPFYYTLYIGQASFTMHRFQDAVQFIKRSITHNPEALPSHVYLAACYGQLGEETLAHAAVAEARRLSPDVSIARMQTVCPYRRAADLDLLTEGLRKAGLPE